MNVSLVKILALLTVTATLLCGCATTSLVDSWRNPGLTGRKPQSILVVGNFKKFEDRRIYEDIIANALGRKGLKAIPSHTVFKSDMKIDRQSVKQAVGETGADAVLIMRTVRVEHQTVLHPGYMTAYPDYWYPPAFPSWDLYDYYDSMTYYEPPDITTYVVAHIQVNLFDARSGKLLWAAAVESSEPGNTVTVSKDMAHIIVQSLDKEGLI